MTKRKEVVEEVEEERRIGRRRRYTENEGRAYIFFKW